MRGGTPGARMIFVAGFDFGSTDVPGCPGTFVSIGTPVLAGVVRVDENGHAVLRREVPESVSGRTGRFQAVEVGSCRVTNVTRHTFY